MESFIRGTPILEWPSTVLTQPVRKIEQLNTAKAKKFNFIGDYALRAKRKVKHEGFSSRNFQ
jgi:hypothetical protein